MNVPKIRFPKYTNNWDEIKLDRLYSFKNGINGDRSLYGNGVKLISVSDILNNNFITHDVIKGKININEKTLMENSVEYGDVLFQRSSETFLEIGSSNVYLDNKIVTYGGFVIRGKKLADNYNNPIFINYELKSPSTRKKIILGGAGSQHFNIGQEDLKKVSIFIPELNEQNNIAEFMSLIDKKIELQSKKIEDLKLFKKGLFHKLFDEIDGNNYLLSDITNFENGKGHENIIDDDGNYILINSKFISTEGNVIKKCSEQLTPLFKDDITMVMSDLPNGKALAKCYYIEEDNKYSLNQRICKIHIKNDKIINSKYLFYLLNRNPYYLKFDDGVNQTNLKKDDILNININIPSKDIQDKNSKILTTTDNIINKESIKLSKLETLKKGLMQNMFV